MKPASDPLSPSWHPQSGHPPAIFLIENHDEAYRVWREVGARSRLLVHVDAHHDMWWQGDHQRVNIGNFICPALMDGLVREVYWCVPDASMADPAARRELAAQIRSLAKSYKTPPRSIEFSDHQIVVTLLGKRLVVGTVESLRLGDEPVLLDIDIDYLIIPRVSHDHPDVHSSIPWRWPGELVEKIGASGLSTDLITISYSVEGCYTPLGWKYLGDELAERLRTGIAPPGYDHMRRGADAGARGETAAARGAYEQAAASMPRSATPHYHLALLADGAGDEHRAREHFARARALDSSYGTGFNNLGLHYLWQRDYSRAEFEFRRMLRLDPDDSSALVGMAHLAARRSRWDSAIAFACGALRVSDDNLDAHRCLGEIYARLGRLEDAILHYERSLQLALHGRRPLSWQISTRSGSELADDDHCAAYAELGRLKARRGDLDKAISSYRIALSANYDGVRDRARLAHLYLRTGRGRQAAAQLLRLAQILPRRVRVHAKDVWRTATESLGHRTPEEVPA